MIQNRHKIHDPYVGQYPNQIFYRKQKFEDTSV